MRSLDCKAVGFDMGCCAGNTVYAGGNFSHARPAAAAPGRQLVTRIDPLAYDVTTVAPVVVSSANLTVGP